MRGEDEAHWTRQGGGGISEQTEAMGKCVPPRVPAQDVTGYWETTAPPGGLDWPSLAALGLESRWRDQVDL